MYTFGRWARINFCCLLRLNHLQSRAAEVAPAKQWDHIAKSREVYRGRAEGREKSVI